MAKIRIEWIIICIAIALFSNWQIGQLGDLPPPSRPMEARALAHALNMGVMGQQPLSVADYFGSDAGCLALFKQVMRAKSQTENNTTAALTAISATAQRSHNGHMFCDYELTSGVRVQYYSNGEVRVLR